MGSQKNLCQEVLQNGISLRRLIGPSFFSLHQRVLSQGGEYVLKGGRGSGKSSFISLELWLVLLRNPDMPSKGGEYPSLFGIFPAAVGSWSIGD